MPPHDGVTMNRSATLHRLMAAGSGAGPSPTDSGTGDRSEIVRDQRADHGGYGEAKGCPEREPVRTGGTARRRWHRGLAVLVAGAALTAAGCSSTTETESGSAPSTTAAPAPEGVTIRNIADEGAPVDGGKFVMGLEAETEGGLNPIVGQFAASGHYLASSIFDPLATLDDEGAVVPYLAESITPNGDFTEWTITVREGVTFHDGTPLTSEAVKLTLDGHRISIISRSVVQTITAVDVVDDRSVTVTMSKPWAQFPYALTTQIGYIPAPSMLNDPEGAYNPVGTGPFVFDSWKIGESFQANRNNEYWQDGKPHLNSIEFRPIPDAQLRADGVLSGELDLIHTVTPRDIDLLRSSDVKMIEVANGEETSITLNTAVPPFDDPVAREAVAAATDVETLLRETGRDLSEAAHSVFVPGQLGYRPDTPFTRFDLERAKQLVAEYEARTGGPLTFVYEGADTVDDKTAQQLLQKMWSEAGMEVEIVAVPQSDQIIHTVLGNYQATDWRNFGAPDPDGDYMWWHSSSIVPLQEISLNVPRLGDAELDRLLDEARATTDDGIRDELYAKAAERLNAGLGYIWLERPVWALAADPRVNGFLPAQNGSISTIGAKTWVADLWVSS
jgi:peptide/nickel transport system substrate-binding protein